MKRKGLRARVLGSIQGKVFNLSLLTIILLSALFIIAFVHLGNQFMQMDDEADKKEQEAVSEVSGEILEEEIVWNLERANWLEAGFADDLFSDAQKRVAFMAECAEDLFAHPDDYTPRPYTGPNPIDDGKWTAKVIFAKGVNRYAEKLTAKLGLLANLSDTMISLCKSFGMNDVYIGLPEGAFFSASKDSSNWFTNSGLRAYDPRERLWYRDAAAEGHLVFTNGEWDANTGEYCIECAAPVYDPEGTLQGVIGQDLFLDSILKVMNRSSLEGEYNLLVNQDGKAVLPMQARAFPMAEEDREGDLRQSRNEMLAQTVQTALEGEYTEVRVGELGSGRYYIVAAPLPTTGWVLVSAFDKAVSDESVTMLQGIVTGLQEEAKAGFRNQTGRIQKIAVGLLVAAALLVLGGALWLGHRIVRPLNTISKRISELDEDHLEFRMEDDYRTGDEVEKLAESFAAISHKTMEYMDETVKMTAEKERIGTELAVASQIQVSMLPHTFPAFPGRSEFDLYASMDPAKEVGGDFYDFFLVDDDHLCLVIADVSGKGVPAAMFMMSSKTIIANNAMTGKSPAQVLTDTNEALCANGQEDMFVTVWIGILEISTGKLTAANGGHEYPALARDGRFELYKDRHGLVLGGMPGMKYRDYEIQLEPGDRLFVYTDGVPEANNEKGEMFGTERMTEALNAGAGASPRELLENVSRAVDGFARGAEQFDDMTMLCVEYKGTSSEETKA